MTRPKPEAFNKVKTVAENRRARYDFHIDDKYEAGIVLTGTEVKSLRFGEGSIAESYAEVRDDQIWLINANIPEFSHGNRFNHEPKRPRKLLLNEREINKLHGAVMRQGMTLVPLSIYLTAGAGRKWNWLWQRVKRPQTSVRQKKSAIGSGNKDESCGIADE